MKTFKASDKPRWNACLPEMAMSTKQLANYIVLGVAYQHWLNMNYERLRRKGFVPPSCRRIDFLREIARRRGVPLRWTVQTQMDLLPYLVERLTPGRLALPVGYDLGDSPRWSSAPAEEPLVDETPEERPPHIRGNQSGYIP